MLSDLRHVTMYSIPWPVIFLFNMLKALYSLIGFVKRTKGEQNDKANKMMHLHLAETLYKKIDS